MSETSWFTEEEIRAKIDEVLDCLEEDIRKLPAGPSLQDYEAIQRRALDLMRERGLEPHHDVGEDFMEFHLTPPSKHVTRVSIWATQIHTTPPNVRVGRDFS